MEQRKTVFSWNGAGTTDIYMQKKISLNTILYPSQKLTQMDHRPERKTQYYKTPTW